MTNWLEHRKAIIPTRETNYEPSFKDFVASVISIKVTLNTSYVGEYTSILTALQDADYYAPINLTDLIFCSESALKDKNKSQRSQFIKCILNEGSCFCNQRFGCFPFQTSI